MKTKLQRIPHHVRSDSSGLSFTPTRVYRIIIFSSNVNKYFRSWIIIARLGVAAEKGNFHSIFTSLTWLRRMEVGHSHHFCLFAYPKTAMKHSREVHNTAIHPKYSRIRFFPISLYTHPLLSPTNAKPCRLHEIHIARLCALHIVRDGVASVVRQPKHLMSPIKAN